MHVHYSAGWTWNRGVKFRDTQCFECRVCVPCVMRTGVLPIICLGYFDLFHLVSSDTCDRTLKNSFRLSVSIAPYENKETETCENVGTWLCFRTLEGCASIS
jgi:hypothetical protein